MLLLDTCAVIWVSQGDPISSRARTAIRDAVARGAVYVSPMSAWEIGALAVRRGVRFDPSPHEWFAAFLARPGVRLAALGPEIALDAWFLPGQVHGDPMDRLLIATARRLSAALVTRDDRILAYARAGHMQAIAC